MAKVAPRIEKGSAASKISARAAYEYEADYRRATPAERSAGLSPARAKREISGIVGRPVEGVVDPVYFRENGKRNPLPASAAKNVRSLRAAVRKRRDAGGTLGRWESVASAAAATLGRPVSVAAAKTLYSAGGGDLESSYVGRGTRVAAPKTLGDVSEGLVSKK